MKFALEAIARSLDDQLRREVVCEFRPVIDDKEAVVLDLLEQEGPLTRLQLAARAGLAPSSMRVLMMKLEQRGIVVAAEQKRRGVSGRTPSEYRIAPSVRARRRRERSC